MAAAMMMQVPQVPMSAASVQSAAGGYTGKKEHALVEKSREQAREASQPGGNG
jgi:hypothetical protein